MPIFHFTTKPLSRKQGRSATAAAAYRSGTLIHDQRTGEVWDYRRRRGVEHAEIVLPTSMRSGASWARDREALWNAAELTEKRKDARTAREYELALPHEFTRPQQIELVRQMARHFADRFGIAVDFAVHLPHPHGDQRNVHAHLQVTTRVVTEIGLGAKASMEWSDTDRAKARLPPAKQELTALRAHWAHLQNAQFAALGMSFRVDHRTLEAQGIEREPTTHVGVAVTGMTRRGMDTTVGRRIRDQQRQAAQARVQRLNERRQLERERESVAHSIRDVSADLAAARRDLVVHQPSVDLADIRRRAREEWLALRAAQRAAESGSESTAGKTAADTPKVPLEEVRRQAREAWLEGRRTGQWDRSKEADRGAERGDSSPDRGLGLGGPDDDFGL